MGTRHRNLLRERIDADAGERAAAGLLPLTQAELAEWLNSRRPTIGKKRVAKISESAISRAISGTPGVARRIGQGKRWVLRLLNIDFDEYLDAWGTGPGPRDSDDRRRGGRLPADRGRVARAQAAGGRAPLERAAAGGGRR